MALIVQIHLLQNRTDLASKEARNARNFAQDSLLVNLAESWVGMREVSFPLQPKTTISPRHSKHLLTQLLHPGRRKIPTSLLRLRRARSSPRHHLDTLATRPDRRGNPSRPLARSRSGAAAGAGAGGGERSGCEARRRGRRGAGECGGAEYDCGEGEGGGGGEGEVGGCEEGACTVEGFEGAEGGV